MMKDCSILLCLLFSSFWNFRRLAYAQTDRELVYLQILTSNGVFNPLELYSSSKNNIEDWPDGLGALTKLGKVQHYELGKLLRSYYKDFITSAPNEVDALSSAEDRSTLSLLCLLASLYAPTEEWEYLPGFHWQPIPVSYSEDDDIFFRYPDECLSQKIEMKTFYNTSTGKDMLEKDKFYYQFWARYSGKAIRNWNDVANLFDTLEKEKLFKSKVPSWALKYWNELKRVTNAAYGLNYQSIKSLQLKIGPLVELMTLRMRAKAVEPDPIKVSVYMTHDWNLAAFLTSIERFNGLRPPPCATISIEMLRDRSNGEFSVRMNYFNATKPELGKQKPYPLTLRNCLEFCPLKQFAQHFQIFIPKDFNISCSENVDSKEAFEVVKTLLKNAE